MDTKDETSTSSAMAKTTTISTIAVQSGKTRIVIALLHVGAKKTLLQNSFQSGVCLYGYFWT